MDKGRIFAIGVIIVFLLSFFAYIFQDFFLYDIGRSKYGKTSEEIRNSILEITPIGSSYEDVLNAIDKNGWEIIWINHEHKHHYTDLESDVIVGDVSIRAKITTYMRFFKVHVQAYWGFDEESKLIAVEIREDAESL